eukprot:6462768-Amphidinium_carterae.2
MATDHFCCTRLAAVGADTSVSNALIARTWCTPSDATRRVGILARSLRRDTTLTASCQLIANSAACKQTHNSEQKARETCCHQVAEPSGSTSAARWVARVTLTLERFAGRAKPPRMDRLDARIVSHTALDYSTGISSCN